MSSHASDAGHGPDDQPRREAKRHVMPDDVAAQLRRPCLVRSHHALLPWRGNNRAMPFVPIRTIMLTLATRSNSSKLAPLLGWRSRIVYPGQSGASTPPEGDSGVSTAKRREDVDRSSPETARRWREHNMRAVIRNPLKWRVRLPPRVTSGPQASGAQRSCDPAVTACQASGQGSHAASDRQRKTARPLEAPGRARGVKG